MKVGTVWVAIGVAASSLLVTLLTKKSATADSDYTPMKESGSKVNTRSTQEPLKVVYGLQRVGCNDVYIATTGSSNDYLWIVSTLAEGECDSVYQVGGADQIIVGDQIESYYGAYLTYYFHTGSATQTVDAYLAAADANWTDTLRNTCYMVWKMQWNQNLYQGMPVRMVDLKGSKVYDFRDGPYPAIWAWNDAWGGTARWGTPLAYSNNHVLCLLDWMTNTRYGMGIPLTRFDFTSWTSAANYIDTKGWGLNMVIRQDRARMDVVRDILTHFRGQLVWYGGQFYLRYADLNDESSVMTITDEHIVQNDNGQAAISISEPSIWQKPDAIRVKFVDPNKSWAEDDIVIGDDNGVVKQLDLLGCTDRETASNLGYYHLERAKLDRTVAGTFRGDCIELEPHDLVTLTSSALDITAQLMRVEQANIINENTIELVLRYESSDLYDDDYDVDAEGVYRCSLPDPKAEPPSVSNVTVSEETYSYRLRNFTRIKVTFDPPANYAWFDHVEVRISYDDATYEHIFDTTTDFEISNIEEGATYYIRLKTINIFGGKQADANDYKTSYASVGYQNEPESLGALYAIVNQNTINLYANKVDDPDIELYEFRLGASWSGGILLGAFRSPNLSLFGVKPGEHFFYANTLSNNGLYGDTPVGAGASLIDPPDGWTVMATESVDSLVTNGSMNTDGSWGSYGSPIWGPDAAWDDEILWGYYATPASSGRSSEQAHDGTYSWKFETDGAGQGIQGEEFTVSSGDTYGWSARIYPDTYVKWNAEEWDDGVAWGHPRRSSRTAQWESGNRWGTGYYVPEIVWATGKWKSGVQWPGSWTDTEIAWATKHTRLCVKIVSQNGCVVNQPATGMSDGEWNLAYGSFTASDDASCAIAFVDDDGDTGVWYVDSVCVMEGVFENCYPTVYSAEAVISGLHSGSLVGTYTSKIFDRTASDRYMVYVLADTPVSGSGTTWDAAFEDGQTWPAEGTTWMEIFQLAAAPSMGIKLKYGDTSPPTNEVEKLEILSCIVEARYYQIEATLTDPNTQMNVSLENYEVKFCQ